MSHLTNGLFIQFRIKYFIEAYICKSSYQLVLIPTCVTNNSVDFIPSSKLWEYIITINYFNCNTHFRPRMDLGWESRIPPDRPLFQYHWR